MKRLPLTLAISALLSLGVSGADNAPASKQLFTAEGRSIDQKFFPVAVWLQAPANAARYKAAGINLYIGLWDGPTKEQLATLREEGMPVVCEQDKTGLEFKNDPIIAGWMHGDEPDNAQELGKGKGYGPPVLPATILSEYRKMKAADPSRPVMLNLGQGVAWDDYIGRGVRTHHPEDYAEYVKGCDIASFDIYPVVHDSPKIAGKLEYVATGVERLVNWAGTKPAWSCIECTHIGNPTKCATPLQVRTEVWMALTHGARGIIYFVHQFKPKFREAALLDDAEMLKAITDINRQITELAPVLNSDTIKEASAFQTTGGDIATMVKHYKGSSFVFAVNMRNEKALATFTSRLSHTGSTVHVLDENRDIAVQTGAFSDDFQPYEVHLYRIDDTH